MGKRPAEKAKQTPPLSDDRIRAGWQGPAGTRIHLARPQDVEAADALMATTGDGVRIIPVLRAAIEDGTAASTMLAGLGGTDAFHEAASLAFTSRPMHESLTTVSLTLVATDQQDRAVGVLSATAPGTLIETALKSGYGSEKAMALSLFVAKVHGLAVAGPARGQGIAPALLKRTWQVHQQLGYFLLYGSYWSTRTLAGHLKRREGISVSWHYIARIWREENLKPHRSGTFKLSKDPAFAEKVADVVGLYLAPPGGAVVLSVDEKTQVQALDRTQPVLPVAFAATEKRTHDYVRHGTTNLFAALNVTTGEVLGECKPNRNGANFLAFLKKAVKPHTGKEIHVALDNLSTHTTPDVKAWLAKNPHVHFHFTPVGSSWLNQIEIWFEIITRQSIRRGTFASVNVLVKQIRDYINSWNENAKPFTWTATADEILAKVLLVQTSVKKLVNNNSK
ncbi:IS630 family transposase [Streptomyces sp. NPDC050548]|uniref:IS630 family transposase n=1 Tax=Streptomyces sp. NPDC050548 TaxID=3365629 RepID=UPI003792E90F